MVDKEKLKTYNKKRDFTKSEEPDGKVSKLSAGNRFVIQKHDATNLHYDLRLEIDGVLVSWAVPKGPSTNPKERRLAIRTEDHPLDYYDFEGVIPEGEYGAGTIMVWDFGEYENIKDYSIEEALDMGKIEVKLKGKKLEGDYAIIRTGKEKGEKSKWLLIKMRDECAVNNKDIAKTKDKSALTNKTLREIFNENNKI